MPTTLTISTQNYLKHIFELTESGRAASTKALADGLGIKPASVTGMLQRLAAARPALVQYQKHQGVTLTTAGRKAALEVIRHHRLIEAWLVRTLGYSWDEVHEEAERLEHVISEDFEKRIAAAMGHPNRDPHGELIPSAALEMPADASIPLAWLRPEASAIVQSVKTADQTMLRHLQGQGLIPGARIQILDYSPFDQNLTVRLGRNSHVLGLAITSRVFVRKEG